MTIAYWCILAAIAMPYCWFGIARNRGRDAAGRRLRDNDHPRDFPNRIEGVAKRAWNAHLNAFEALPGFAAAVIVAHLAGASQRWVDGLALLWTAARLCHGVFYLLDRNALRSAAQFASMACLLMLFVISA